jgi:FAD/FMN-containing dehydrogenase
MIDKYPALIVRSTSSGDVVEAVNSARGNDLLLSVRGSGHNLAGTAVSDGGLMSGLSLMKDIQVDPEDGIASAQPGVVFGEMDQASQPYGLAAPGGIVSETGIAGLTLRGSFGWLTRKYGFTCNSLVSAEVVTANAATMPSSQSRLGVFQLGGAIKRYDERAMAVSHRNAEYIYAINTGWADPQDTEMQIQWTRDLWTAIRPFSSGGVYVSLLSDNDGDDRVRAAYGAIKFERLVQLKSMYDPQNLFQMNKKIEPVSQYFSRKARQTERILSPFSGFWPRRQPVLLQPEGGKIGANGS